MFPVLKVGLNGLHFRRSRVANQQTYFFYRKRRLGLAYGLDLL